MTPPHDHARSPVIALSVADAGELLTLQRAAYVSEARLHDDLNLPPLTEPLETLQDELARRDLHAWGIREHGRLVAAVRVLLREPVAELGRLAVAPDRQGHGLGSLLLRHVENNLPAAVTSLELFTGERSEPNLRLYRRHGYRETHRTPTGPYDLVHLRKSRTRHSTAAHLGLHPAPRAVSPGRSIDAADDQLTGDADRGLPER